MSDSTQARLDRAEASIKNLEGLVKTLLTELRARGLTHLPKATDKKARTKLSPEAREQYLKDKALHMVSVREAKRRGKTPPKTKAASSKKSTRRSR